MRPQRIPIRTARSNASKRTTGHARRSNARQQRDLRDLAARVIHAPRPRSPTPLSDTPHPRTLGRTEETLITGSPSAWRPGHRRGPAAPALQTRALYFSHRAVPGAAVGASLPRIARPVTEGCGRLDGKKAGKGASVRRAQWPGPDNAEVFARVIEDGPRPRPDTAQPSASRAPASRQRPLSSCFSPPLSPRVDDRHVKGFARHFPQEETATGRAARPPPSECLPKELKPKPLRVSAISPLPVIEAAHTPRLMSCPAGRCTCLRQGCAEGQGIEAPLRGAVAG